MQQINKTDKDLINEIKSEKSNEAYTELVNRHSGLFQRMFQKYEKSLSNSGVNNYDILEDRDQVFVKAIYSFDESKKTKFNTWLGNQTKFHCLNLLSDRINFFHPSTPEECFMVENQIGHDPRISNDDIIDYVENILGQLHDKRIHDIIKYRFLDPDKSHRKWKYICEKMDISSMAANQLCQRGLDLLKNKINSKSLQDVI